MQTYIKKWRESLIDPYKIEFENLTIGSIYNYPPAGNDVMECNGFYMGNQMDFFIKIERSKLSAFDSEVNVLNKLPSRISDSKIPKVLGVCVATVQFFVTSYLNNSIIK